MLNNPLLNPEPEQNRPTSSDGLITLTTDSLDQLNAFQGLALIQDGKVLPLIGIEGAGFPVTQDAKIKMFHAVIRTLLDATHEMLSGEQKASTQSH